MPNQGLSNLQDSIQEELKKTGDPEIQKIWEQSAKQGPRPFNVLLLYLRTRKQLNQSELSRRFSAFGNPNYIGMLERGERNLDLNRVADMASALDVDPTWLEKRWMYEYFPEVYKRWFGSTPQDPDENPEAAAPVVNPKISLSEEDMDLLTKMARLPNRKKFIVRALVNEMYGDSRPQIQIKSKAPAKEKGKGKL